MREYTKLEQALMTVVLATGIIVAMVIETAAMYAGAALILIGIAVAIYSLARHGQEPVMEPARARVIPREAEKPPYRKAA